MWKNWQKILKLHLEKWPMSHFLLYGWYGSLFLAFLLVGATKIPKSIERAKHWWSSTLRYSLGQSERLVGMMHVFVVLSGWFARAYWSQNMARSNSERRKNSAELIRSVPDTKSGALMPAILFQGKKFNHIFKKYRFFASRCPFPACHARAGRLRSLRHSRQFHRRPPAFLQGSFSSYIAGRSCRCYIYRTNIVPPANSPMLLLSGWKARSLVLFTRLFSPEPESSHADGPSALEQHGRIWFDCIWCHFIFNRCRFTQLEPVGNKTFTQDFSGGIDLKCPSEVIAFLIINGISSE